jgi:4'-phosphopantetheinyl transferase
VETHVSGDVHLDHLDERVELARPTFFALPPAPSDLLSRRPFGADVWRLRLDVPESRLAGLEALLAPDEQARASRYATEALRRRFIARRGQTREILASTLGCDAAALAFATSERGRPYVTPLPKSIDFNLSDSGDLALLAVVPASIGPVGIDVERVRPVLEPHAIAARWFSESMRRLYRTAASEERPRVFFAAWTRTEAAAKALGVGIVAEGDSADSVRCAAEGAFHFEPAPGHVAAIVPGRVAEQVRWLDAP